MINKNNKDFFTRALLLWNKHHNDRSMPWKGEKDPYKIWLSEIILQQTRVEQGWNYYNSFIKTFPKLADLAMAKEDKIFKMWEGLGYYSRCKNLIATAKHIHSELSGAFPSTYEDILKLKGVGTYTASAIASFAFDLPHAVVDGNVNRVLSRFFGIDSPIDSTEGKKVFEKLALELLPKKSPGLYNQAIMDFGATVCKPQLPLCVTCPLKKVCIAFNTNQQDILPVKSKKLVKKNRWFYYIVVEANGKIAVRKRTTKDIWQNLHEFLLLESEGKLSTDQLSKALANHGLTGIKMGDNLILEEYKQQLTHQTVHVSFIELRTKLPAGMMHVTKTQLKKLAFPRVINDYLEAKEWK